MEESVEKNDRLRPPSITICSTVGWVGGNNSPALELDGNFKVHCPNEITLEGFLACIEQKTFNFSDLVVSAFHGSSQKYIQKDLSDFKYWTWDMSLPALGRCYTLNYNVALGIDALTDGLWVSLNPNMSYYINLHASSFFSFTTNKLAMPTTATHMSPATGNSPQRGFLLTLEVSRRKNINRIEAPCNPSHNYNFTECVLESKDKMIGCTLPWNMKISGNKM